MRRRRSLALGMAVLALGGASIVGVSQVAGDGTGGSIALVAILAPHLVLTALALAVVSVVLVRRLVTAGCLLAVSIVSAVVLGPEWISLPEQAPKGPPFRVMTWNLELDSGASRVAPGVLVRVGADLVALQELTHESAMALERDPTINEAFPYRVLRPDDRALGMGLLSRVPLTPISAGTDPPHLAAEINLQNGTRVAVVNAHPLPGRITTVTPLRLPVAFDAAHRDESLRRIRALVESLATEGPVILLGDLNTAPTEGAYDLLLRGLSDVHAERGVGPGWTWRPSRLEGLGMGLLRIDYVVATRDVRPLAIETDCAVPGDHCLVVAHLAISEMPASN